VLEAERGDGGFGYDPLFLPEGQAQSAAQLDPGLKNRLSHRGQALARLHALLGAQH
jgi:XTP/dITP diphosphohydrolase